MTYPRPLHDEGWLVVIRPDAVIEAVAGGAPDVWVGREVGDVFRNIPELAAALPRLIDEAVQGTMVHRVRTRATIDGAELDVELLLLEAVPLRRAATPLAPLIMRTLDAFVTQAKSADVELDVRLGPDLPEIVAIDGEKLAWVLSTLVGGALRHAAPSTPRKAPRIEVEGHWDGATDEIVVTVSDNGPGIAPERLRWLFQADPSTGKSAGLALLMARDILIAHRGSIEVASDPQNGTRFTLRFPRRVRTPRAAS